MNSAIKLVRIAVVSAVYVALSMAVQPLTYGLIQIRFSELLVLMCCYNRDYCWSLILGCLIVNIFSPLGWIDVVFGTLGTVLSVVCIRFIKREYLAFIPPTFFTILVALEFWIVLKEPFWLSFSTIMAGEFIAVGLIGTPIFWGLSKRNDWLKLVGADEKYFANKIELAQKREFKKTERKIKKEYKIYKKQNKNRD